MGRHKEFDEDTALDAAMHAFWAGGYEATSTQDLCDATGLCRSSIYHTFGSKRELYERALRRYDETRTTALVELLRTARPVRQRVADMFDAVIDAEFSDDNGCLTVNALVELGARDAELVAGARAGVERVRGELRCMFEAGRACGEVATGRDPAALADFVYAAANGIRVMARAGAERADLDRVAQTTLAAL